MCCVVMFIFICKSGSGGWVEKWVWSVHPPCLRPWDAGMLGLGLGFECGILWYGVVWCGVVWCGVVGGGIWCGCCHFTSLHFTSHSGSGSGSEEVGLGGCAVGLHLLMQGVK